MIGLVLAMLLPDSQCSGDFFITNYGLEGLHYIISYLTKSLGYKKWSNLVVTMQACNLPLGYAGNGWYQLVRNYWDPIWVDSKDTAQNGDTITSQLQRSQDSWETDSKITGVKVQWIANKSHRHLKLVKFLALKSLSVLAAPFQSVTSYIIIYVVTSHSKYFHKMLSIIVNYYVLSYYPSPEWANKWSMGGWGV